MITRTMLTATTVLALAATPALAQQHQHGQGHQEEGAGQMMHPMSGMHQQMMGGGMMGMMHGQPAMLLQASDALGLTPEQVEGLTALRDRARPEHQQHMQAAMAAHRTAATALEGDAPDLDGYEEALTEASQHMVMAHVAMARSAVEARGLLTAEQRTKLEEVMSTMDGSHGGMMQGHPGHGGSAPDHGGHH